MKKFIVHRSSLIVNSLLSIFLLLTFNNYLLPVAFAQTATLSLSPSTGTFNKSCNFSLDINLNTGGAETDGTDAILIYDPARLSAQSITNGSIYPEYPGNNIDEVGGKITISGLASISSGYTGSGTLATVNFKVKDEAATGATQVKFDFDPQDKTKTTDSNVVQRGGSGVDILNSVTNGSYTVGTGSCATQTQTGINAGRGAVGVGDTSPSSSIIYPPKTLPNTGTVELTATIVIVGSILAILGILGLAIL